MPAIGQPGAAINPASTGKISAGDGAAASGDSSHAIAPCATSAGSTNRFIAVGREAALVQRAEAMPASSATVRVKPGDTALTRTPARPHSAASVCVSWMTPAFAAV